MAASNESPQGLDSQERKEEEKEEKVEGRKREEWSRESQLRFIEHIHMESPKQNKTKQNYV